ncbi:MAG: lysophospholipase [Ruminococcaceae bacterium]|nr:lysophospholipase [Oscillospiraceae bacterium]
MKTILFQGDSITDAGRYRANPDSMGNGYAGMAAGWIEYENPGKYHCLNRGIGGNRIGDLYARIREDLINLKPDIVSILIGVNDVWSDVSDAMGSSPEKFQRVYSWIIREIQEALPDTKIMLLGPYVVEGKGTCNTEEFPHRWEFMRDGVAAMDRATAKVAEEFSVVYIPLQTAFDEALTKAPSEYWTLEGVHPTPAGYEIIKRQWLKGFAMLEV